MGVLRAVRDRGGSASPTSFATNVWRTGAANGVAQPNKIASYARHAERVLGSKGKALLPSDGSEHIVAERGLKGQHGFFSCSSNSINAKTVVGITCHKSHRGAAVADNPRPDVPGSLPKVMFPAPAQ